MRRNQSGATVVVVISVIATLAIFIGGALDYTFTVGRNVERSNKNAQCTAIANGCIQKEFMYWREICRTQPSHNPALGVATNTFSSVPLPTQADFPNVTGFTATTGSSASYTVSNYGVTSLTPQLQPVAGTTIPPAGIGQTATTETFFYRASATVTLPDRSAPVNFNAYQIFEQQYQNPWDWAIFFNDPLEIQPGANFTIDGWVQTNSSLYTAMSDLTFGNKVTYGTNWYIGYMPGDGDHSGDTPAAPSWPANLPPVQGTPGQPFGLNPTDVFNTTNPNATGYQELIQPPNPASSDPLATQRYFNQAGLKIILSSNSSSITATLYDNSTAATTTSLGTSIGTLTYTAATRYTGAKTTAVVTGSSTLQKSLANTFESALSLNQSIQDDRETETIPITELNIGTISSAISANPGNFNGFNQVVYIDDTISTASAERAVELTNGTVLPSGGLTIACANPVYIQGDYNTGTNPPSDSGNTTEPTASGYTRQPSSVIADAVDILSNSWSNSLNSSGVIAESTNSLSGRVATSTTVNAAIMAGNVPTGTQGSNYSGGAENFPRFLEDWSNATLTYYGSMVELFASQQATHPWPNTGNVYNPPTRAWYYDTNFQIHPPPGSIMIVSYLKGQWYQL